MQRQTGLWQFDNKKIASKPYIQSIYNTKYFVLENGILIVLYKKYKWYPFSFYYKSCTIDKVITIPDKWNISNKYRIISHLFYIKTEY